MSIAPTTFSFAPKLSNNRGSMKVKPYAPACKNIATKYRKNTKNRGISGAQHYLKPQGARAAKFNTSAMGSEQIISYKKGRRGAFLLGFRVFGRLKVWFSTLAVLGIFLQKTPVTCWLKAMLSTLIQERFLNHILRRFGIGTFFQPVFLKHLFQLKVKGQIAANHRPIRIGVQRGHIQIFERLARPH